MYNVLHAGCLQLCVEEKLYSVSIIREAIFISKISASHQDRIRWLFNHFLLHLNDL
jgi:hypothetical protein